MQQHSAKCSASPYFSIIVPAYNVEPYIIECLESLRQQTYGDFEVIVINDGSTDNTEKLIKGFILTDRRFKFFTQENKGLSQTRNCGLTHARGHFVLFIDSDDTVVPDCLELIEYQSKINKPVMIHYSADILDQNTVTYYERENKYHRKPYNSNHNLQLELLDNRSFISSACLYAIARDYIEQHCLYFETNMLHEDEIYTLKAIAKTKRHAVIGKALYLRRIRENSIMTAPASQNDVDGMVKNTLLASKLSKELCSNNPEEQELIGLINIRILKYFRMTLGYIKRSNRIKDNFLTALKLSFIIIPHGISVLYYHWKK